MFTDDELGFIATILQPQTEDEDEDENETE